MLVTADPDTPVRVPRKDSMEHVEEMKGHNFYDGLNPENQCMLAHKVNGKIPATFSDLLLAVRKLERWEEARDPLLLETITTGGWNVTQSLRSANCFLLRS